MMMSQPTLIYRTYSPSDILKDYVVEFWTLKVEFTSGNLPVNHRLCAQVYPDLVFGLSGVPLFNANSIAENKPMLELMGPGTHYKSFGINGDFELTGMTLRPVTLSLIFKLDPGELKNKRYSAEEIFGAEVRELICKLADAGSADLRIQLMSLFLYNKIASSPMASTSFIHCIDAMERCEGRVSMEAVANQTGLSRRHFERRFVRYTGVTPHLFARLLKFRSVLLGNGGDFQKLSDLAYALDYYDQSHFIREFRAFSGESPKVLLSNPRAENLIIV